MRLAGGWGAMAGTARRRPVRSAALLYAVLAIVFVGPALLPGRTLSNSDSLYFTAPWAASRPADLQRPSQVADEADWAHMFEPFLRYNREEFPGIPLWNPYLMSGRPWIGNAQSGVFAPLTLPALVLPLGVASGLVVALKLFAAAFGMFLLARSMGLRWAGAFLAGLVFAFAMPMVSFLLENVTAVWPLLPWLLLATRLVVMRAGALAVWGLAATAAAVFLSGHPETIAQVFAGATAFLILQLLRKPREPGHRAAGWAVDVGRFAGGVLWGAALAAVAIAPFVELLLHSSDIAERGVAVHRELPGSYFSTLFLPDYWGRGTGLTIGAQALGRFLYAGALPLLLAAVALLRPTVERVACAAFAIACTAVAFGVFPFADVANVLPGLSKTDNTRLVVIGLPALALLAGWGLDDLRASVVVADRRRVRAALILAGVLLCVPLSWLVADRLPLSELGRGLRVAWGLATPASVEVMRLGSLVLWLTMAGLAAALVALRLRGRISPAAFGALAVALVVVDLFRAGMGFNPAIARDHATQPTTGAIRYLQSRRPARFVALGEAMPGNLAMRYRLYDARGYDFPIERRYRRLWVAAVNPGQAFFAGFSAPLLFSQVTPESTRTLGILGVSDIMVAPGSPPPRSKDLTPAYRGADATVYANRRALPRAFVVSGQRVVKGEGAALAALREPAFEARSTVIRERSGAPAPAGPPPGRARVLSYQPDRVVLAASATRPATVVLSDLYFPGWKATVDGASVDVDRVDYLLRGVRVGPGTHRIVFTYRPVPWRIGVLVSGLAFLALLGTVAIVLARRRRAAQPA